MAAKLQQAVEERPTIDKVINEFEFAGLIGSSTEWVRWFAGGEYCIDHQIQKFSYRGNTSFPCLIHFARQAQSIQRNTAEAFRPGSICSNLMPHGAVVEHHNPRAINPTSNQFLVLNFKGPLGRTVPSIRTVDAQEMLRLNQDQLKKLQSIVKYAGTPKYKRFILSPSKVKAKQFSELAQRLGFSFIQQEVVGITYLRLDRLFELFQVIGIEVGKDGNM
ncbi:hypothetical protein BKA69DRAFT_769651 [Paraphysoderma sedebokerense]|nr:hypothetical protein BKA69DRAFT_769651 [Paraphysoderma sedebokerense]